MWTIQHELSTYFIYVKDYRLNIGKGNNISKLYEINRLASFFFLNVKIFIFIKNLHTEKLHIFQLQHFRNYSPIIQNKK